MSTPSWKLLFISARIGFGLLTLAAIGTQLTIQVQQGFSLVNFFSYFTNLSNILAAVILLIGALYLIQQRDPPVPFAIMRGTAVVCMAVVGIVFSLLLRNEDLGSLLPWVNSVLHYVMPVVMVLDWLYQPREAILVGRHIVFWLIFPVVYVVYSLIRGAIVGFYAYPFLNPAKAGGYSGVARYIVGIVALFLMLSWLLMLVGNNIKRLAHPRVI